MKSPAWLKALSDRITGRTDHCPRPRPRRRVTPLRLEGLEDRSVPATLLVNSIGDDGSANTLRRAVEQANAADVIAFDPTVFATPQTITLTGAPLTLTENLTITGADRLTVYRSEANSTRVLEVNAGAI